MMEMNNCLVISEGEEKVLRDKQNRRPFGVTRGEVLRPTPNNMICRTDPSDWTKPPSGSQNLGQ